MAGLQGTIGDIGNSPVILDRVFQAAQMQQPVAAHALQPFDKFLVQGIVLVGARRQFFLRHAVFQPDPLKYCCFVERGWRIGVVFQHLGWSLAVVDKVKTAIERRFVIAPAVADQVPGMRRNGKAFENFFSFTGLCNEFQTKCCKILAWAFDIFFNLFQRETVIGGFIPVGITVHRMKIETEFLDASLEIFAFPNCYAPHEPCPMESLNESVLQLYHGSHDRPRAGF